MCELFAMSSRLPAAVNYSLEEFSRHGGLTGPHRDGWGIAYYDEGDVNLFREPRPAATSDIVRFIERHDFRSRIVLSHIRRATQGAIALRNTQPFARELAGRMHLFLHNGNLANPQAERRLRTGTFRPIGETDSEYAFCALLERLRSTWSRGGVPALRERLDVVAAFAADVSELGVANFIYCDGEIVFTHGDRRILPDRPDEALPGLHVLCRGCVARAQAVDAPGLSVELPTDQDVALVATVPLTAESWAPLPRGTVLALSRGRVVARRPERAAGTGSGLGIGV